MSRRANSTDEPTTHPSEPDRQFVTALARGLEILQCFDAEDRMLGTTDIAQMTGLAQPTVWRLCYTLQKTGFLSSVPGKDKLQLGTAAIALGAAALAGQDALEVVRPMLQAIANRYQVAVALGRREGNSIVYLLRCQGNSPLLMNLRVGSRIPLFHSAIGWAYLANSTPEVRDQLLEQARANGQLTNASELKTMKQELARYAQHGFVYHERPKYQINTVAAGIKLADGERFVVSCGGPTSLLPTPLMLEEVGPLMSQLARELHPVLLLGKDL
ncbi:IclR family transcriptional regulator [Advenella sp. S44]|uniref:IclR family transcriptional regulator n=1 Tax=Advenella sp. S44 TaxID=1982755 RepID=UPI000C2B0B13|nr:IclR family transcriptional regulator [Advenella sp. S44]PJX26081.1 IclR family transcriptional regulator [Advenella sp. S44]